MSELDLREASAKDFAVAIDWAAAEGWNPGLDDMAAFHAADPGDFFLGWQNGKPVASISVVRYGETFGFLGFYIVHPDHRGQGLGLATWNHGLAWLEGRTVDLYGVVAQQDNYRKSGFVLAGQNLRHSGVPLVESTGQSKAEVRDITGTGLFALLAYDSAFFAAPRDAFVSAWILPGGAVARWAKLAIVDGEIAGYGVVRRCRSGAKVGPLFAESEDIAADLFTALCKMLPGEEVALDTPLDNLAAVHLAERCKLQPVLETARMDRGPAPQLPLDRTFGITTFELG